MTQNKAIILLIIIILIFGGILALKMTGIIKTSEKPTNAITSSSTNNSNINTYENTISNTSTNKNYNSSYYTDYDTDSSFYDILTNLQENIILIAIVSTIISITLAIGTCKLYAKLGMPNWTVKITFLNAFLPILFSFSTSGVLSYIFSGIEIILGLLSFVVFYYYFVAVGMPGWIPFLVILTIIPFVGFIIALVLIVAYVISNIKLANIFNKGIGFKIGLIFLPFIFQPILGYQKT